MLCPGAARRRGLLCSRYMTRWLTQRLIWPPVHQQQLNGCVPLRRNCCHVFVWPLNYLHHQWRHYLKQNADNALVQVECNSVCMSLHTTVSHFLILITFIMRLDGPSWGTPDWELPQGFLSRNDSINLLSFIMWTCVIRNRSGQISSDLMLINFTIIDRCVLVRFKK